MAERRVMEQRHEAELLLLENNQSKEQKKLDKSFTDKSDFLKNELLLLEEELRSITAPVEMLSSLMNSSKSSVPLSVTSAASPTKIGAVMDDMRKK